MNKNALEHRLGYSVNAELYQKVRPTYPPDLFEFACDLCAEKKLAWDCATGNGQAAIALSPYFKKIIATDVSREQMEEAPQTPNIEYLIGDEQLPDLITGSVDLVTVATAIHWLDNDKFFKEADRVLKPNGVLAIWGYRGVDVNKELSPFINWLMETHLQSLSPDNLKIAYNGYEAVQFPYKQIIAPEFSVQREWNMEEFANYLLSFYGALQYYSRNKKSLYPLFKDQLKEAWGDPDKKRIMTWELVSFFGTK